MKTADNKATAEPVGNPAEKWNPKAVNHDDSLIQWMLGLTPTQRLAAAQGFLDSVRVFRSGRRTPIPRHS